MNKNMMDFGFIRTAAAVPVVKVADVSHNVKEMISLACEAFGKGVSLLVFPELSVTGCSCADLFLNAALIRKAEKGTAEIVEASRGMAMTIVAGVPVLYQDRLYDCAVIIRNGNIKGIVPKTHLTAEEYRWFASGSDFLSESNRNDGAFLNNGKDFVREGFCAEISYAGQRTNISPNLLFDISEASFAVEVGSDHDAVIPPSSFHSLRGAQIIANPSAEKEAATSEDSMNRLLGQHSAKTLSAYILSSAGWGESSQDNVYAGSAAVWEMGELLAENERFLNRSSIVIADIDLDRLQGQRMKSSGFGSMPVSGLHRMYDRRNIGKACETDFHSRLYRHVEPHPFAPEKQLEQICSKTLSIQVNGLMTRLSHINCRTAVIGISGGLDSTLALLVTVLAADRLGWSRDRIIAVTMPGFGTTSRTKNNAWELMEALGTDCREISIVPGCEQHFKDISHNPETHDATYENSQARERTQILMDVANQTGGIVIGTGDLSELALGWATYNGDHMSMYGVNAGVPKTLVKSLVIWAAENRFKEVKNILLDIADTPISPELLPADTDGSIRQVTEDLVGPYELHDFFIYNFICNGYTADKIYFLALKAFSGTYDKDTIAKWLQTFIRRFFSQQFKRSCMPDGPATGKISLSPRGGWAMPSDAWNTDFHMKTL